jgi:hypothetical protein
MFKDFKEIVKTRWKYLLGGYIFGYIWFLSKTGVPNIYYLIPIKTIAVPIGWIFGNMIYRPLHSLQPTVGNAIGTILLGLLLWAIAAGLVAIVCWILGVDPTPFW